MSHLKHLGKKASLDDLYKAYKPVGRHVLGLAQAAFDLTDELTQGECELIGAYVAGLNRCDYCHAIHSAVAVQCGIEKGALPALGGSVPRYGADRWRPVYAYVGALTAAPGNVSPAHITSLQEQGWSDDAIVQLATLVTVFNTLNRLADGLGIEAGPKAVKEAGEIIAKRGYTGVSKSLRLGSG